jgi:hypothetical protein
MKMIFIMLPQFDAEHRGCMQLHLSMKSKYKIKLNGFCYLINLRRLIDLDISKGGINPMYLQNSE